MSCRMLQFLCRSVARACPTKLADTAVLCAEAVRVKFRKVSAERSHLPTSGLNSACLTWKRDLDSFYNRVDRGKVIDAVRYIVGRYRDDTVEGRRRNYLKVRRRKDVHRDAQKTFIRPYGGRLRMSVSSEENPMVQPCNAGGAREEDPFCVFPLSLVEHLVYFEVFDVGILLVGRVLIQPVAGITQGACASPGIAQVCLVSHALANHKKFDLELCLSEGWLRSRCRAVFMRWVDDIQFWIQFFFATPAESIVLKFSVQTFAQNLFQVYESDVHGVVLANQLGT